MVAFFCLHFHLMQFHLNHIETQTQTHNEKDQSNKVMHIWHRIEIEINKKTRSLFVDLMEKNMIFLLLFKKACMIYCVYFICCDHNVVFFSLSFTYKSWMGFMQINTTNDGQLCLISDFICGTIKQSASIKAYRDAPALSLGSFYFHHREYWNVSKTIDCYLSKRFIIDIECMLCAHIGMLVCLFAFFFVSGLDMVTDLVKNVDISKMWFSCAFD